MCGLLGQYNYPRKDTVNFRYLLSMSTHRGPDQTGIWSQDRITLGFNRLAILDLTTAGNQPMLSPNEQYAIVFNGEIYNHIELRAKLPQNLYRGSSDTETITHALEYWGVEATIKKLDGMFALAIYALTSGMLYLARDFAGIKPLYFGQSGKAVVFASQYDQVRQHPVFSNTKINPSVLKLYLMQHYIPAPFGLHEGIEQVRPGEIIQFDIAGKRGYTRYWELSNFKNPEVFDADKANQ